MGVRGYVKERSELTPMGPFDVEQGIINSGPDSCGVPEWMGQMDLASACVLRLLNRLVLDFKVGSLVGRVSGGPGIYQTGDGGED